jgi:uncharacterized protein YbbK (DUF523 family)
MSQSTIPEPSWKALGAEVRYDGGHKHDRYLTDVLGDWFDWVPVCPEIADPARQG